MKNNPVQSALLSVLCAVSAVMIVFTAVELGDGVDSSVLWIGLAMWVVALLVSGFLLWGTSHTKGD